ncbi:fructose-specific PTS transporter subunit EIIC [Succinivibrio sp.]|uniref:PTS fructose transporter subunit IIABC n=1 Tax=Succinivibrio sp. TaxID=2053619 RepID=UPI002589E152|nr:fructose-specific PTS transporter subunit EIIC [Succinivibrio sp.]MDD6205347.1 fructose-specific PTS transporter subunit EIIC [Succinivibrio sp.]
MHICDLLDPRAISLGCSIKTKEQAINMLVDLVSNTDCLSDKERFRTAVFEREQKVSTGLGAGVAIPHAKSAGVKRPALAAMVVPEGVDFESLDGQPSKLFFLIASPHQASDAHLDVLARLSTLLVSEEFRDTLINCQSVDSFLKIINTAEKNEIEKDKKQEIIEEEQKENSDSADHSYTLVAVTACPAGLSHTYMAAEALENKAKEMGITIKVETDGAAGNRNRLLPEDIAKSKGVIVAADRIVDMDRFIGKPLVRVGVVDGVRRPQELIEQALDPKCPRYQTGVINSSSSFFMRLYRHLMSGMTYIMPIVACAGILSALARFELIQGTQIGFFLDRIGYSVGTLLFPILSAFIAFSIRGRTALVAGFAGGVMADLGSSGVIGAVINGFIAGGVSLLVTNFASKFLRGHDAIVGLLLYPVTGSLFTSAIALFFTNIPAELLNTYIQNFIQESPTSILVVVGAILGGMMSADMGGPFNKVAYAVGVLLLADCIPELGPGGLIMASVMAGGMVPPLAAGISCALIPQVYSDSEKKHALSAIGKGCVFITEGVIPFLSVDMLKMKIACIISSATAGALSMYFRSSACAPHGGIFVIPLFENVIGYAIALGIASTVGAFLFALIHLYHQKKEK